MAQPIPSPRSITSFRLSSARYRFALLGLATLLLALAGLLAVALTGTSPAGAQDGYQPDPQLLADVPGYARETDQGYDHVSRWLRTLHSFKGGRAERGNLVGGRTLPWEPDRPPPEADCPPRNDKLGTWAGIPHLTIDRISVHNNPIASSLSED